MKTAVIYARYSSDSQTEQSIEGQLRVCEDYARNNDILILDTYIDRAMTGTNDNRPDFQRMLKNSSRCEWNYVLVYKFDRFSRNKYETAVHKKTLKDNGTKVISATEFVPDTPEGIILESMLEGYAEYYSAELSQKIRRGNNESRHKGNLKGGRIPYCYKNVNKKAVIVPEQAEVVRYIYEQYSIGVYVKDIIKDLTSKGIYYYGKPFVTNTVYKILKNERYSGVYHYNGETFNNIYPQIVPQDIFDKVRVKVIENQYGKNCVETVFLLRHKMKCGYCGQSIVAESGTSQNGEKKYYYKCRGRKARVNDCNKSPIRKDLLENMVLDFVHEVLSSPQKISEIVNGLMNFQEKLSQDNTVLNLLIREKRSTDASIQNIMCAIEKGVITNTTTKRLKELEEMQENLERQIIIERGKTAIKVSKEQIREFFEQALTLEPQILINYLIKEIVLFDDKIDIYFNSPIRTSPDHNGRGFSFYSKIIKIAYKVPQRRNLYKLDITIEIKI